MEINFTSAVIAAFVGTLLTVFFAYFPKVRVWYASMEVEKRSLLTLGLMVVIEAVLVGLSYVPTLGLFPSPLTWQEMLAVAVALILSNQPVASVLPAPADVRAAIKSRSIVLRKK